MTGYAITTLARQLMCNKICNHYVDHQRVRVRVFLYRVTTYHDCAKQTSIPWKIPHRNASENIFDGISICILSGQCRTPPTGTTKLKCATSFNTDQLHSKFHSFSPRSFHFVQSQFPSRFPTFSTSFSVFNKLSLLFVLARGLVASMTP